MFSVSLVERRSEQQNIVSVSWDCGVDTTVIVIRNLGINLEGSSLTPFET